MIGFDFLGQSAFTIDYVSKKIVFGPIDLIFFGSGVRDCPLAIRIVGSRTWSNMGGEVRARQVQLTGASLGAMPWGQRDAFVLEETGGAARRAAGFVRGDLPEDSARGLRP